ncbi:helix-turn-helix transcriptional regulator [Arthrobacter sp. H41]|uniref:helix-turn-helix transcriptional regulator n=1 Tax=Arthrobacter sp. H41 TaxID=1312978 RepID=UPI0012DD0B06|nr:helix-turn-helix transcriptional regulator [Arthrobacter sp. H41]
MHLHILTKEQLREGSLRLHNGVWVLAKPLVLSGEVASGALAKLDAFPGQERFVVEILALAGELPLNILGGLVDPSVVDRLEERLVLETKLVRSPVVQLKDRLFADSIRANLPPGRRRSLWEDMMPAVRPSDMTKLSLPHYVLWGLDSGARPDDELLLAAASTANELRDPAAALRIVQVIEHRKGNPRAVVEEARALAALGRWDEADSTLSGMEPLTAADAPEVVAAVLIENLRVSRSVPRDTAAGLDESLRSAISAALHQLPESNQAMLTSRLVLAEAEQLCFEGRYSEIPETVFGMYGNSDLPFSQRVRAGGMTAEAFAMTGRQHESVELSRSVLDELWQDDLPGSVRGEVHFQVFTSLMVSGMFAECLEMLERGSELKAARLGELVGGELARGLVHAYCGRADLALQSLHPAVSQLQVQRPGALLQLAHAATAYVLTLQQETGQAQEHAALARTSDSRGSWIVGRATSYFLLLSRTHHSEEAAAAELLLHAEAELLRGNSGHGLSFLSAAVRMAGKESGARLAEAAQKTDGLLGEMSEHLGNGLFLDDAQLLLKAARLARDAGNTLLYFESAAAAHAAALRSGNRSDIKVARTLENASYRQLHYSNNPDRVLTLLTPFELELARRAAKGTTSAELGRKLNLSTRTVDWHLGRLFDKLHVSGRVELSEIVS